jgi:hypothetical protein
MSAVLFPNDPVNRLLQTDGEIYCSGFAYNCQKQQQIASFLNSCQPIFDSFDFTLKNVLK